MNITRHKILYFLLVVSINAYGINDSTGVVTGNLILDNRWEPKVYLSVISSFDRMYTMSRKMIVAESPIDNQGNFSFDITFLPKEETLLRIHIVKKGNPPTTLVIGGKDENHFFFIAHKNSGISIRNIRTRGVFYGMVVTGSPGTVEFNRITQLSNYPNLINYDSISLEKEFVEKVVNEKLRLYADTCENPLTSLYAIYKSDFESDLEENKEFYTSYLKKWEGNKSSYFNAFRKQLPIKDHNREYVWFVAIAVITGAGIWLFLRLRRKRKVNRLSVQERKIFGLLQQGATNQEISNECHIELSTVKSHVSNIFSKLKIKSRKDIMNMKL